MYDMTFQKMSPEDLRTHKGVSFVGITTPFICYDKRGRIFMAKRSKQARDEHGRWDCGAGGLKHGQSLEENMRRELMEEYGVEPIKSTFIGYFEAFRQNELGLLTHWLAMPFAVLVDPAKLSICEPEMVDDSGWFALDALPSPLHSQWESTFYPAYGERLRAIINNDIET